MPLDIMIRGNCQLFELTVRASVRTQYVLGEGAALIPYQTKVIIRC